MATPRSTRNLAGIIPPHMLLSIASNQAHVGTPVGKFALATLATTSNLFNTRRPHVVGADTSAVREVYDAKNGTTRPGTKARFEGDPAVSDKVVNDAYDFTGFVRDFYKQVHGRDSIDNHGMKLISTVHYDQGYDNAYWDGSQMTYGDGDGTIFKSFVILDVCGHEITHGVTQFESNLEYQDEPGALNESHSDVFGKLIEAFSKKQTVDKIDWVLGRGIFMPKIKGEGIRNMMHPGTAYDDPSLGKDPQPAHYKDLYKGWDDNGGVHYNSGIVNRAFALFATDVGGYAWEKAGVIWYAARAAAGATPSFAQFAWHTLDQSAKVNGGAHTQALKNAWDAVGVVPQK